MSSSIANWIAAVCLYATSILCFFVITAILITPKTRSNAFNIYVVCLILPDALMTFSAGCSNLSWALAIPMILRMEIAIFVNFLYFAVNFNANAVVTYEVNKLIIQSHRRQRTKPPDLRRVYKQMITVFLLAIMVALWAALPVSWSIYHATDASQGFGSPPSGGPFNFLTAALITYGTLVIPAAVYVVSVSLKVWRKKLLPRKGRTRMLSVFFLRVVFVFLLFYIPNAALAAFVPKGKSETAKFWLRFSRGMLTFGQACTTLYFVALKDDIYEAIIALYNRTFGRLCCQISTPSRKRESSVHVSGSVQVSGSIRISGMNPTSAASSHALWPSVASKSFRISEASQEQLHDEPKEAAKEPLPPQTEWEAEDEYDVDDDDDDEKNEKTSDVETGDSTSTETAEESRFSSVNMAGEVDTSGRDHESV